MIKNFVYPDDKLSERKAELLQQRKDSKQELKQL